MKRFALLAVTMIFALGLTVSSAFAIAAGEYHLYIMPTPVLGSGTATTAVLYDAQGWNSSFTFGSPPLGGAGSNVMLDNPATTASNAGVWTRGTGDVGQTTPNEYGSGYAGDVQIHVYSDGTFTVTSFQVDVINATAGGNFAQYGLTSLMSGTIDGGGNISFSPEGRKGAVSAYGATVDLPWNINLNAPATTGFTSGGTPYTGSLTPGKGPITGSPIWTDSTGSYAVLVSGGQVGSYWGGFWGNPYYEAWRTKIELISLGSTTVIPEPGSLLLIGSGLVGLVAIARKRAKK